MNINYDKQLEQIRSRIGTERPQLLLHVCCAPCATACLLRLIDLFDVTLYYANDNITSPDEWTKRLGEVQKLVRIVNDGLFEMKPAVPVKLQTAELRPQRFFEAANGLEEEKEGGARCAKCFELRLADARDAALAQGFDYFCTTLTVSPYKNSQLLNEIGLSLQTDAIRWLPADFKKQNGYNESVRLSNKYGLYRQHYCGCPFSIPCDKNSTK